MKNKYFEKLGEVEVIIYQKKNNKKVVQKIEDMGYVIRNWNPNKLDTDIIFSIAIFPCGEAEVRALGCGLVFSEVGKRITPKKFFKKVEQVEAM